MVRDTLLLRSHLQALVACLPFAAGAAACGSPEEDERGQRPRASTPDRAADAADAPAKDTKPAAEAPATKPVAAVEPRPRSRFDPVAGDPPLVDGYNPEEASCPSGNWCGSPETVAVVAVPDVKPNELGCPPRITGARARGQNMDGKEFRGLSKNPVMLGAFNDGKTERERAKGKRHEATCCYHWFDYCSGRPLLVEGDDAVVAELRAGGAWDQAGEEPEPEPVSPAARERIASEWLGDALMEHAAIGAFARATLELMAVGAPPELLAAAQQAGIDEVDHARRCFALARRFGAGAREPGAIETPPPRAPDLARLARDTFLEGCVGETIAALVAGRAARAATDPVVRTSLRVIADDEARHAALAWSTLAWALPAGGEPVRRALADAAARLRAETARSAPVEQDVDPQLEAALVRHGRLPHRERRAAREQALNDIIGPMLDTLLAGHEGPQPNA